MAKKKLKIDWEKGEKLYRLGQLSSAEIGKQLGCSTSTVIRHMEKFGITQDKGEEVRRRTKEAIALQCNAQRNVALISDNDIDEAVNANLALVFSHRKDLSRLGEIEDKLLRELEDDPTKLYIAQFQGQVIKEVVALTVSEKASTLLSLSNVRAKRIEKQRQAFSIDSSPEDTEDPLKQILEAVAQRRNSLVATDE